MSKRITPKYVLDIRQNRYTVENAVEKIFEECQIDTYPVNVFEIARKLNFDIIYGYFKDSTISGAMWDGNGEIQIAGKGSKRCIIINAEDSVERRAFTVGHELGHFMLHCQEESNFFERYHGNENSGGEEKKQEDEADFFAASLLMPVRVITRYIEINSDLPRKKLIDKICADFLVEEEAVERRFKELGYSI